MIVFQSRLTPPVSLVLASGEALRRGRGGTWAPSPRAHQYLAEVKTKDSTTFHLELI